MRLLRPHLYTLLILLSSVLFGWAQEGVHFVVNGQACHEGRCTINLANLGYGRSLRLGLAGTIPDAQTIDFSVQQITPSGSVKGVILEYHGHSISAGHGWLHIPRSEGFPIWGQRGVMLLHLGDFNASQSGIIRIQAYVPGRQEPLADVTLSLEGLRAPGGEFPWNAGSQFDEIRPTVVPIYPNPVKSGMVHIDLQGVPYGKRGKVSIIDLLGGIVYSTPFTGGSLVEFPSDGLPKGVYFVRIDVEEQLLHTGRLVVDK